MATLHEEHKKTWKTVLGKTLKKKSHRNHVLEKKGKKSKMNVKR